jgi:hypothetical protein
MMKTILSALSALLLSGMMFQALATSYAEPEDRVVKSPNGKFALKIHAKKGLHEVKSGKKVLWSFQRDVWHDDYFVSNDGQRVLWVSDRYVSAEDANKKAALAVYSSKGVLLSKTGADVSKPRRYYKGEMGPIGDHWRIWRGKATQDGDVVTIETSGKPDFAVDLTKLSKKS